MKRRAFQMRPEVLRHVCAEIGIVPSPDELDWNIERFQFGKAFSVSSEAAPFSWSVGELG
jgi:hypothetical protein